MQRWYEQETALADKLMAEKAAHPDPVGQKGRVGGRPKLIRDKANKYVMDEFKWKSPADASSNQAYKPDFQDVATAFEDGMITAANGGFRFAEIKSPFTGGLVALWKRKEEVIFRGEKLEVELPYYKCLDTDREFTDSKLDEDRQWATFRAYWEKKGFDYFYDIDGYDKEAEKNGGTV